MKNFLNGLILICIGLLIAINVKMMFSINDIQVGMNEKNDLLQSQINDLKKEKEDENKSAKNNDDESKTDEKDDQKNTDEIAEIPVGKVSKDKFKVCSKSSNIVYEKDEFDSTDTDFIKVKIENGKVYISYDAENRIIESILENRNAGSLKNKELTGFSAKPVEVYYGAFGQDVLGEKILFLMDDGTVEYIDALDIVENEIYKVKGPINGLNNIKKFDILSIFDKNGGGAMTTIAIDEDGYYYDINEML